MKHLDLQESIKNIVANMTTEQKARWAEINEVEWSDGMILATARDFPELVMASLAEVVGQEEQG